MEKKNKIWLTSDLHFGHDREFLWSPRGFASSYEHDEAVIKNWNEKISWLDEVYLLGDLMLGDNEKGIRKLQQLAGKWHIILGNHDTNTRIELYKQLPQVIDIQYATMFKYNGYRFYCSHFPTMTANLEKESLKQCTINLYGHTHQQTNFYNDIPFMYHVGLDSHNNSPVLIDEAIQDMQNKVAECKKYL